MAIYCWHQFERVAAAQGGRGALFHGHDCLTFAELRVRANAAARALDLDAGEVVVLSAHNSIGFVTAVLGVWACGGIPCLLHPEAPDTHRAHALTMTDARMVLSDGEGVYGGEPKTFCLSIEVTNPPRLDASSVRNAPADPALAASIVLTSGSTGLPKGVTQSGGSLFSGARRVCESLDLRPDDRIVCLIPFSFDYGWGQLLSCLLLGHSLVLPKPANAFGLCDAIERHRPTVLAAVPALVADLMSGLSPIRETDTGSIRLITSTGSRMPSTVAGQIFRHFPDAALSLNYGLTETYRSTTLDPALARQHPASAGRSIEGVDIRVVRPDGSEAAVGENGEIVHRGAGLFMGYWGDEEATRKVLRPDPFDEAPHSPDGVAMFTGDIGFIDENGLLHVLGRRDGQMKSMGVRVSREEIENLLLDSGLLHEAAVIARSHDQIGDMVVAIVNFLPTVDEAEGLRALKRHANSTMSKYMRPRDYVVTTPLPRNSNGKIDYPRLRAEYA